MDIIINKLPVKTFNRLGMNETEVVDIPEFSGGLMSVSVPEGVLFERQPAQSAAKGTGLGEDFEKIVSQSGAENCVLKTEPGVSQKSPVMVKISSYDENSIYSLSVNAGKGSSVTVIMDYAPSERGGAENGGRMFGVKTSVEAEEGSSVCLVQLLRHDCGVSCLNDISAVIGGGAKLNIIQVVLGGRKNYLGCRLSLTGDGGQASADIGYLTDKGSSLDMNYNAVHTGKNTGSDINVSGVLKDGAFKLFRGTIDFQRGASGSKGNVKEDVLLLDDNAVNQTIPLILCAEEDVEGNHGATVGELDEELVLYMQSRGFDRQQVYEEMSRARINAVCSMIPDAGTRQLMEEYTAHQTV